MTFVPFSRVAERLRGKRVAVVGSGPGCAENAPGVVDGHDIVVRVSNYKTGAGQGFRTDAHYSFYGTSIDKPREELIAEGCTLCMCKLPDSAPLPEEFTLWHRQRGKIVGIDYRYIYRNRANWWFCETFVPDDARFLAKFDTLGHHQPTTGFAAILDVLDCEPAEVFLTGFDFFTSGLHNVDEPWREKKNDDPICHRPDLEAAWIKANAGRYQLKFDKRLAQLLA